MDWSFRTDFIRVKSIFRQSRNYLKSENIDPETYVAIREVEQASFNGGKRIEEVLDRARHAFQVAARSDNHVEMIRIITVLKRALRYYGEFGAHGMYARDELPRHFVGMLQEIFDRTNYSNASSFYLELAADSWRPPTK